MNAVKYAALADIRLNIETELVQSEIDRKVSVTVGPRKGEPVLTIKIGRKVNRVSLHDFVEEYDTADNGEILQNLAAVSSVIDKLGLDCDY